MVTVRERVSEDLPDCVRVLRAVHERDGYPARWPADPTGWLNPTGVLAAFVALRDGELVGHGLLGPADEDPDLVAALGLAAERIGVVQRLFVRPDARRLGLAERLLTAVADAAVADGRRPALEVVADAPGAIAFYDRQGWQRLGSYRASWRQQNGRRPLVHCYVPASA